MSVGDFVAFPNTAGYLMHILESSSHQIPLARNLVLDGFTATLDPIDVPHGYSPSGVEARSAASASTES